MYPELCETTITDTFKASKYVVSCFFLYFDTVYCHALSLLLLLKPVNSVVVQIISLYSVLVLMRNQSG